jgi:crotonobetainyl-CoA:carnitine CoA-transferase CaiB-like acyl-CoA transferase
MNTTSVSENDVFSRFAKGGCLAGDHTEPILTELGFDDAAIADLRKRDVVS